MGGAFAPIYPLVVEKIGHRFPYYHPGFYNGIFSFAMVGGLLAPCTLGYFAWLLDVRAVMGLPLIGSIIVFVLLATGLAGSPAQRLAASDGIMLSYVAALACLSLACPAADLEQRLDSLTSENPALGFSGIQVVEASTGKILYSKNADRLFLPASNLKILTSALALERLRPDYRFTTRVVREASGDVVLVGSGDPSLSGRVFPYQQGAARRPPIASHRGTRRRR